MTRALARWYHAGLKAYLTALASRPAERALLPLVAWTTGCEGIAPELVRTAEQNVLDAIIRCLPCLHRAADRVRKCVPAQPFPHHTSCGENRVSASAPVRVAA